jgi:hypothetical protein
MYACMLFSYVPYVYLLIDKFYLELVLEEFDYIYYFPIATKGYPRHKFPQQIYLFCYSHSHL